MQYEKETAKREILEVQLIAHLKAKLAEIEEKNSLDYMEIKLVNHEGKIQCYCTTKEQIKAY